MSDQPHTPDEIEQRLLADGTFDDDTASSEVVDRPLDPDEIEQRQEVGYDEDDYRD